MRHRIATILQRHRNSGQQAGGRGCVWLCLDPVAQPLGLRPQRSFGGRRQDHRLRSQIYSACRQIGRAIQKHMGIHPAKPE